MPSPTEFPPYHTLPDDEQHELLAQLRAHRVAPPVLKGKGKKKKTDRTATGLTLEDLQLLFPHMTEEELKLLLIGTPPSEGEEPEDPDGLDEDESDEDEDDDEEEEDR